MAVTRESVGPVTATVGVSVVVALVVSVVLSIVVSVLRLMLLFHNNLNGHTALGAVLAKAVTKTLINETFNALAIETVKAPTIRAAIRAAVETFHAFAVESFNALT